MIDNEKSEVNSLKECEDLKRKTNWNLINNDIDRIYIFDMASTDNTFRVPNDLGEFLLCTWGCSGISHVKIMMRLPHKKEGVPFNYVQIGKGDLWGQDWKIQDDAIVRTEHNIKYLPLNGASLSSKFVYLAFMDNSDMECCDARYNKGSHSSTYFCVYCLINRPEIYFGDDVPYRTPQSLAESIELYDEASNGRVKLPSGTSALQYSKGMASCRTLHEAPSSFFSSSFCSRTGVENRFSSNLWLCPLSRYMVSSESNK